MTEDAEGVEEGKMEKKAEEKVAEAKLGVLCSLEGMPRTCLPQEAEPQSPTMAEHKPCPDGSTAEGHIKVTDRIAGQKKVFWKRQKTKSKMQTAEAAGTEGGPQNTRAPFCLQDFMCFKISKHYTVLFLLMLLASTVYSSETPKPVTGMCAVCQDHRCATDTTAIWKGKDDDNLWKKEISNCSMDNLNSDVPCRMPNGWLVLLTDQKVLFEWRISPGERKPFTSVNMSCTELGLHSSPKPSPAAHNTSSSNPSTNSTNSTTSTTSPGILDLLTENYGIAIGVAVILVAALIAGLIYKKRLYNCLRGQDRGRHQGNNRVPPHDTEHRDEIAIEIQPLNAEVANGNVNGVH